MVELTYGLPYQYEDHTTAIMFIDAQLEKINSHASFPREQDRLKMIRILRAAREKSQGMGRCWTLDYYWTKSDEYFKPDEEDTDEDVTLQAALSAQVRKPNYENQGAAV